VGATDAGWLKKDKPERSFREASFCGVPEKRP
jgi:hypothetical protein